MPILNLFNKNSSAAFALASRPNLIQKPDPTLNPNRLVQNFKKSGCDGLRLKVAGSLVRVVFPLIYVLQ